MTRRSKTLLAGALALVLVAALITGCQGTTDERAGVAGTVTTFVGSPSPVAGSPTSVAAPAQPTLITPAVAAPATPGGSTAPAPVATPALSSGDRSPVPGQGLASGFSLALLPAGIEGAPPQVQLPVSATLPVEVRLQNTGGQQVDGVEVHLEYDPSLFEVVDDAGAPVGMVTAGSLFPLPLQNQVDPRAGRIDFAFGRDFSQAAPSTGGPLARFNLRPKGPEGAARLQLRTTQASQAAFGGRSFPLAIAAGGLTITVVR